MLKITNMTAMTWLPTFEIFTHVDPHQTWFMLQSGKANHKAMIGDAIHSTHVWQVIKIVSDYQNKSYNIIYRSLQPIGTYVSWSIGLLGILIQPITVIYLYIVIIYRSLPTHINLPLTRFPNSMSRSEPVGIGSQSQTDCRRLGTADGDNSVTMRLNYRLVN